MALAMSSPAIDAGDSSSAPPTDQRGVPRPCGAAADIGAYEAGPPLLRITPASSGGYNLLAVGLLGQSCRLLASSNLTACQVISTNPISADGAALMFKHGADTPVRFYKVAVP